VRGVDHRTDIYAAGVLLFQMITDRLPFEGTPDRIAMGHLKEPPPDPCRLREGIPTALGDCVRKALAKEKENRFQDAEEFASALRAAWVPDDQFTGSQARTFRNGDRYEGEWRNGKRHGRGKYIWADGTWSDGEWKDNQRFGQCVTGWPNGDRYVGRYDNDRASGGWYEFASGGKRWFHQGADSKWAEGTPPDEAGGGRSRVEKHTPPRRLICVRCRSVDPYDLSAFGMKRREAGLCPYCEGKLIDEEVYRRYR
jgi:hypothetical protein